MSKIGRTMSKIGRMMSKMLFSIDLFLEDIHSPDNDTAGGRRLDCRLDLDMNEYRRFKELCSRCLRAYVLLSRI